MTREDEISKIIVSAAYRIATKLGPGLSESAYERILARDLTRDGLKVERQKCISFDFEGMHFRNAFRVDLLVEGLVIVEVKCNPVLHPKFFRQLLTYLRLMKLRLGLLLNFACPVFRDGIKRVISDP